MIVPDDGRRELRGGSSGTEGIAPSATRAAFSAPICMTFALIVLAVLLAGLQVYGLAQRRYNAAHVSRTVSNAAEAYSVLRDLGVRDATLVLLDTQADIVPRVYDRGFMTSLTTRGVAPPFQPLNMTGGLIETGVVREVYLVPPASVRRDVAEKLGSRWDARTWDGVIELRYCGAPVHVVLADSGPSLAGRGTVVLVNGSVVDEYPEALLRELESPEDSRAVITVRAP